MAVVVRFEKVPVNSGVVNVVAGVGKKRSSSISARHDNVDSLVDLL